MTTSDPPQADSATAAKKPAEPPPPPTQSPADETAPLMSKAGEIADAVLTRLQETQNSGRTITLIINAGRIENAIGSVGGNVSNGSSAATSPISAHADASLPVDQWFQASRDVLDATLMTAAAFLPGAPFGAILAASHRLAALMNQKPPESSNPFSMGRTARLERLGAEIRATPDAGHPSVVVERLSFRDPSRTLAARHYLWVQATDLRPMLTQWLTELSEHHNEEVAYTVGFAVGDCAAVDLSGIFNELMERWAFSEAEVSRIAAGQALGSALDHPGGKELARAKIELWSGSESPRACQRAVASLCRSSWAVREPQEAMKALKRLERTEKVYSGRWVQQAINTMWVAASLFSDDYPELAGVIVENLGNWSSTERSSAFYTTPQLHLAFAVLSELPVLREQENRAPLLLRLVESDEATCRKAAALLGVGLARKASRKPIRTLLDTLVRAHHMGEKTRIQRFLSCIAASGNADDRARLESYLEGWRVEHKTELRLDEKGHLA